MLNAPWPLLGCVLLVAASFIAHTTRDRPPTTRLWFELASYAIAILGILLAAGFAKFAIATPHGMIGDNLHTYSFAKNFINGFASRINPNLGFPGVLDNAYFPSFDFSYRAFLGLCSLVTNDPVVAYNSMYVAGIATMAAATLASFRFLSIPNWLAIPGAAVYVISPYFIYRSLGHDFLSLYISVPMGAALAIKIGTLGKTESVADLFRRPFVWVAVFLLGTSGLYYAFFTCMFVALTGVCAAIGNRRLSFLVPVIVLPIIILPLLVTTGYGSALIDILQGNVTQVRRFPFEQLSYGLSMADASQVFADLPFTKWAFDAYLAIMPRLYGANGLFEWPGIFLTIVILLSPAVAMASALYRSERSILIFISATCISFGLIYAERGGLGYYFNLFVTPQIRAPARIMPYLSFFAIVAVLSVVVNVVMSLRKWQSVTVSAVIICTLLLSAAPNLDAFGRKAEASAANPILVEKYASVKAMNRVKDKAGVMAVLQLPHMAWPEVGPKLQFDAYDHELPYLLDTPRSLTRWSYGATINQDSFKQVGKLVAENRVTGLVESAKALGFDAVLIEKTAYNEQELATLRSNLAGGASCLAYKDQIKELFLLRVCDLDPGKG